MSSPFTKSELIKSLLNSYSNKEIFIQVGFNRFSIETITEEKDYILLVVEEDANNPIGYPKDKSIA